MLIPDFARLLGEPPELFRIVPGELRRHTACFDDAIVLFGWVWVDGNGMFRGQSNLTLPARAHGACSLRHMGACAVKHSALPVSSRTVCSVES